MYKESFLSYGRTVICWKLVNFSKDLINSRDIPFLPALQSPDFKVSLSNYETTYWKFIALRNKTELTLFMKRKDEILSRTQLSSDYIINYEMQLKDQLAGKDIKRTSGKVIINSSFEEKLGKIINYRECAKPKFHQALTGNCIQVIVYLEIIRVQPDVSNILNSTLTTHYEKMFNNENFSDFLVTTSDNEDIFVHKNILATRSPVFEAMINSTMKEGNEKKVLISDITGKTLMELIRFIYSGKVINIDSIAGELLYAANKYDIQDLKPLCIRSLALNTNAENVLDTILMADLHQEQALKNYCMDLVKWKYNEVQNSESWKNFKSENLKELLDYVMSPTTGEKDEHIIVTNIKRTPSNQNSNNN